MAEGFLDIPEDPDKVSRARAWKNGGEVSYHCRASSHILHKERSRAQQPLLGLQKTLVKVLAKL